VRQHRVVEQLIGRERRYGELVGRRWVLWRVWGGTCCRRVARGRWLVGGRARVRQLHVGLRRRRRDGRWRDDLLLACFPEDEAETACISSGGCCRVPCRARMSGKYPRCGSTHPDSPCARTDASSSMSLAVRLRSSSFGNRRAIRMRKLAAKAAQTSVV
jgi:hypothetical protein